MSNEEKQNDQSQNEDVTSSIVEKIKQLGQTNVSCFASV